MPQLHLNFTNFPTNSAPASSWPAASTCPPRLLAKTRAGAEAGEDKSGGRIKHKKSGPRFRGGDVIPAKAGTTFSHGFGPPPRLAARDAGAGTPPPLTSIPESGFQQFHTSSRPRRYRQKNAAAGSGSRISRKSICGTATSAI
jgi:hypothetical protein